MSGETVISAGPFSRISPGYRLNEIYEIDSLLATGGMGEVYRGHAIETGDQVAIKTIRPEFAQNNAALALFKKEASSLRNLYHEAIVRYFVFSIDKGLPYLAMEYVEGKSLSDFLQNGPLTVEQLGVLQKRLASGLNAAHELGIVHRDVSPDNIILPGENLARAKIIDFGIARSNTGEGTVIGSGFAGKFSYVSPEQLGLFGGDVTGQSDIYSLGLVLAECALGKSIDMGHSHVDVIEKRRKVPDLSGVDARLRPLITSMLQPNPKDRPASMADIAVWTPGGSKRGGGSGKGLALAAGIILVLGGLGGGGFFFYPQLKGLVPSTGGTGTPAATAPTAQLPASAPPVSATAPSSSPPSARSAGSDLLQEAPPPRRAEPPPQEPPRRDPQPSQAIASLPTPVAPQVAPDPLPTTPRGPVGIEQISDYLRDYNGGDCFYVSPVTIATREAKIEAFGATPAPFMAFDSSFQSTLGFEPEIDLRQVTAAQCPVVDFLARKGLQRTQRAPRLTLKSDRVRSGQELSGTIEARPDSNIEIFLVADDGLVHNLGAYGKKTGDTTAFTLRVEASATGDAKPQMVVAVATSRPIPTLKITQPSNAERFFRQTLEDASRANQLLGISVRYFKLGG